MSPEVVCRASPSLALIKYWGKSRGRENVPATPSLAVTLGGATTQTRVRPGERDEVYLDGVLQDPLRFEPFFRRLRQKLGAELHFHAESHNDFPSAAGLASSSSGFAALAVGCTRAAGLELAAGELSALARLGSASAARSLFGGFVLLPAGALEARPLYGPEFWPELRVLVAVVSRGRKPVSSRQAMESTRRTSPYYRSWLRSSTALLPDALEALRRRDLQRLGEGMLLSYSRMHAAMLSADPPLLYWLPGTVAVIAECRRLRGEGVGAWETIDAGPQVKVLCVRNEEGAIRRRLLAADPGLELISCRPGEAPACSVGES